MKILEIKKDNEVFEVHHNVNGYFLQFGAKSENQSNIYEMNLDSEDVAKIKSAFTKSKLAKKPKYKTVDALKANPNNW